MRRFFVRDDRGDGLDLRTVRHGGETLNTRLYFAVRDDRWGTVPLTVRSRRRTVTAGGFVLEIDAVTAGPHPMDVMLRYVADVDELVADVVAVARGSFTYARIGFCLLFGADVHAGRRIRSWQGDTPTAFAFPRPIVTRQWTDPESQRFHRPFDRLETVLGTGTRLRYVFEGERFEFEDQRNWTDASYKAYSVRPDGAWPASAVDGQRFAQRLTIRVDPSDDAPPAVAGAESIALGPVLGVLPSIDLYRGRLSARSYRPAGGFHEFNELTVRPAADSIELGVNGAVHTDVDDDVLEATSQHGVLVAQARARFPDLAVRLAPLSFLDTAGDWRDETGGYRPEPPENVVTERLSTEFAATWAIASAASAVPAGVDALRYFDDRLPVDAPATITVGRLAALAGRPVLAVAAPAPLAALAVAEGTVTTLAVANTGPDKVRFRLPGGREETLAGFGSAWFTLR